MSVPWAVPKSSYSNGFAGQSRHFLALEGAIAVGEEEPQTAYQRALSASGSRGKPLADKAAEMEKLTQAGARISEEIAQARRSCKLIVVIPAYNEEKSIEATIKGVASIREPLAVQSIDLNIVVVNDGSRDQTGELAVAAGADHVETHKVNRGLGAAVRTGLTVACDMQADIAVKFDADLQHDPADILELIAPIVADRSDLVYGSRFSRIDYKMPLVRRWGNRVFRALMKWLTGWPIEDSQPGIFATNRDYLAVFEMPGDYNYTQQILLDAFLKNMRFSQVPVAFHERKTGKSFVSLKYPYRVLRQIILVIAATKPMKIFGTAGAIFLAIAFLVFVVQIGMWLFGYSNRPVQNVNLVLGAGLFGLQMLFFGILARLIVLTRAPTRRRALQKGDWQGTRHPDV